MTNPDHEPRPVLPLDYAPTGAGEARPWSLTAARWAMAASLIDLLVGWMLIFLVSAETVLATAPILMALGLALAGASWRMRFLPGMLLGLAHCCVCLLFAMLVNVRGWSPREATLPFTVMGGVYVLGVALPVSFVAFLRLSRRSAWRAHLPAGG